MFDLKLLLTPLTDASPCGPNLEYDPTFLQLEAAARVENERRIGHSIIPAVEPDWPSVRALSLELFSRTKDLRIAMYLLRAELRLDGVSGLSYGLKLIAGLLLYFNDTVHPLPDSEEGEGDMTIRMSALAPLDSLILSDLRAMHFGNPDSEINGRSIEITSRDLILEVNGEVAATVDQVHVALQQEEKQSPGVLLCLSEALEAAETIGEWINQNCLRRETTIYPDLGLLKKFITLLIEVVKKSLGKSDEPQEAVTDSLNVNELTSPCHSKIIQKVSQPLSRDITSEQMPESICPLEIEVLLEPISASESCGPDLEYDPQFTELERAAKRKPQQQFGETVIAAEEPNWHLVLNISENLFSRTKDLRIAIYLLRAATRLRGINGAALGLQLIHGLLTTYWDRMHPTLDADENNDPTYRVNLLSMLSHSDAFLSDLRSLRFGDSYVTITGRQIELALGDLQPDETDWVAPETTIRQALMAEKVFSPGLLQRVYEVHQTAVAIEFLLVGYVGDMASVLQPLLHFTRRMHLAIQRVIELKASNLGNKQNEFIFPGQQRDTERLTEKTLSGEARQDAISVLEQVGTWLEQVDFDMSRECRRAKRLSETSFIDIARCLMPDRVDRVEDFLDQMDH